jgi:hypothetical protein
MGFLREISLCAEDVIAILIEYKTIKKKGKKD